MTQARKAVFWLPSMLWAATLFVLSAQSSLPKVGPQFHNVDKTHHFIAYAVLAALVMLALRAAPSHLFPVTYRRK